MTEEERIASRDRHCACWRVVYLIAGSVSGLSLIVFVFFVLQPILVVVFTLGGCVSGGCEEWLEFSEEVFAASLIPLTLGVVTALIACTAYLIKQRIAD